MTNLRAPLALLFALGPVLVSCSADSPGVVVPGTGGNAGTTGQGISGTAGTGSAGTSGATGCEAQPIFAAHSCTMTGACHDSKGTAAGFDMESPGWEKLLVGRLPTGGGVMIFESMCFGKGVPYLYPDVLPAKGLFLNKLAPGVPFCGLHQPTVGDSLSASELDCVQRWADALVTNAP